MTMKKCKKFHFYIFGFIILVILLVVFVLFQKKNIHSDNYINESNEQNVHSLKSLDDIVVDSSYVMPISNSESYNNEVNWANKSILYSDDEVTLYVPADNNFVLKRDDGDSKCWYFKSSDNKTHFNIAKYKSESVYGCKDNLTAFANTFEILNYNLYSDSYGFYYKDSEGKKGFMGYAYDVDNIVYTFNFAPYNDEDDVRNYYNVIEELYGTLAHLKKGI